MRTARIKTSGALLWILALLLLQIPMLPVQAHPLPSAHHLHLLQRLPDSLRIHYQLLVDREVFNLFMGALDRNRDQNISPSEASDWFGVKMGSLTIKLNGATPEAARFTYSGLVADNGMARMMGFYEIPLPPEQTNSLSIQDQGCVTPMDDFFFQIDPSQSDRNLISREIFPDPALKYGTRLEAVIPPFPDREKPSADSEGTWGQRPEDFAQWVPPLSAEARDAPIPEPFDFQASWTDGVTLETPVHPLPAATSAGVNPISVIFMFLGLIALVLAFRKRHKGRIVIALIVIVQAFFLNTLPMGTPDPSDPGKSLNQKITPEVFRSLHENMYRQYDLISYPEEERAARLYQILSQSLSGRALEEEHARSYRRIVTLADSETLVRVLNLEYQDISINENAVSCVWTVAARLTHLNHSHERLYSFSGRFNLSQGERGPRISSISIDASGRVR